MSKTKGKITSYEAALKELQSIVQEFQDELVNIDQLPEKMKRAADLIQYCRGKLRSTEEEMDQLFKEEE